jgi:hypothetical protein
MKKIELGGKNGAGKFAIIDDDDFDLIGKNKWHFVMGYAVRDSRPRGARKVLYMHRVINKTPDGFDTDHIDGNRLNNQKINLRDCNRTQSNRNRGKHTSGNSSKYKGIILCKRENKYIARINISKDKRKYLGSFKNEKDAVIAYNNAAVIYHGEFARLNKV